MAAGETRPYARTAGLWPGAPRVCRLGLATRGNTSLTPDDVRHDIERGIGCLNWCGRPDGMSAAIRELTADERERLVLIAQIGARDAAGMRAGLDAALAEAGHGYLDCVTLYYIESEAEWERVAAADGALTALREAKAHGRIRAIGLTSHQRRLAARLAETGELDMLMVRYNAAHRGAEDDVFPVTRRLGLPVATYTGQRWGALARATRLDPPAYQPFPPPEWYRFVLACPDVAVAVMAPDGREELEDDLSLLDDWFPPTEEEYAEMLAHGDRVRATAREFV